MTTPCLSPRTLARDLFYPQRRDNQAPRIKALAFPPAVAVRSKPAQRLSLRLRGCSDRPAVPSRACQRALSAVALFSSADEVTRCS